MLTKKYHLQLRVSYTNKQNTNPSLLSSPLSTTPQNRREALQYITLMPYHKLQQVAL